MREAAALLRRNGWTVSMLVVLVFFYAFIHWAGQQAVREPLPDAPKAQAEKLAPADLKQKEETFKKNMMARPRLMELLSLALLALLTAGIALDIRFLQAWRARRLPSVAWPDSPWGLSHVLQAFVFLFFGEACLVLFEIGIFGLLDIHSVHPDMLLMANSLMRDVLLEPETAFSVFDLALEDDEDQLSAAPPATAATYCLPSAP